MSCALSEYDYHSIRRPDAALWGSHDDRCRGPDDAKSRWRKSGPSLAGNSSCAIVVKFNPTTAVPEGATLTVGVPQEPTSPVNVTVTGTGM